VSEIAAPGKMTTCGYASMYLRPSFSITPQLAAGGGTPNPRKLSDASTTIAVAKYVVVTTISGASVFGRMWRNKIHTGFCPMQRAA